MAVFGLLGRTLSHSLSPQLHNMIYRETGFSGTYNLFETEPERVREVVPAMRALGIAGMNVTIPYKQDILPCLDALSPEAEAIGAVNTVQLRADGQAWGYNTDCYGFVRSLRHAGVEIRGRRFLLCGMSGAGKAVRWGLLDAGAAEVLVASTDPAKGIPYSGLGELPAMDCIVNCTPLGMHPKVDACVVEEEIFQRFHTAVDIVYNPLETLFLHRAKRCGLQTVNGLYMLIFQGIQAFTIWTGIPVEDQVADPIFQSLSKELNH